MPIASYLVIADSGCRESLLQTLSATPFCEPVAAREHDCILLVTDTPNAESEETLRERLECLPEVAGLAMVFGSDSNLFSGEEVQT